MNVSHAIVAVVVLVRSAVNALYNTVVSERTLYFDFHILPTRTTETVRVCVNDVSDGTAGRGGTSMARERHII